ncbi:MAG: hypothetical protein IKQ73_07565 [Oscillospiraceae bacterium]|nr:hypothetical protein [Oscillospiraceae bacterium]
MAAIYTNERWSTLTPAIYFDLSYTSSRSGTSMLYNFSIAIRPLVDGGYGRRFGYPIHCQILLDGVSKYTATLKNASQANWSSSITASTGNLTVSNKTTGTTALTFKLYSSDGSTRSGTYTYTLPILPAASNISVPSTMTCGSASTISITAVSSDASYHVLTLTMNGHSETISSRAAAGNVSYTPPASLATYIPSGNTASATVTCSTYNRSGTLLGSTTGTTTITVPVSYLPPTVSASISHDSVGQHFGGAVQGKSKITITGSYTLKYGATAKSVSVTYDGVTYSGNTVTLTPAASGSRSYKVSVTDSRGYTGTYTGTVNVMAYAPPSGTISGTRGDSTGSEAADGAYLRYTVNASITALNNINAKTMKLQLKKRSASSWTDAVTKSVYSWSETTGGSIALAADDSYDIRLELTDYFGTTYAYGAQIPSTFSTIDFRSTGKGIAFGKASERDAFECNMSQELRGQLQIWGDIIFDRLEQSGQRVIRFANVDTSTNHHDAAIIGGNPSTATGIGAYDFVNSAWIWQYKTGTQKLSLKDDGQLTLTYTSNNYVSSSSFGYVSAYRRSNVYMIRGNLEVTTAIPTGTNWTQIGSIGNYSAAYTEYLSVAAQNGSGVLAVRIESNGTISIANTSGSAVNGLCRFSSAIPTA